MILHWNVFCFGLFSFFAEPRQSRNTIITIDGNGRRRFHPDGDYRRQNAISFTDAMSNRSPPKNRADTRRPSSERRQFSFARLGVLSPAAQRCHRKSSFQRERAADAGTGRLRNTCASMQRWAREAGRRRPCEAKASNETRDVIGGTGKREKKGKKETERGMTRQVRLVTSWMISAAARPDARPRARVTGATLTLTLALAPLGSAP